MCCFVFSVCAAGRQKRLVYVRLCGFVRRVVGKV